MDKDTSNHFWTWIAKEYGERPELGVQTASLVMDFVRDHPHVLEIHGWSTIRDLAERNLS